MENSSEKILLHGSGEHARVVLDCLLDAGQNIIGLFDPKHTEPLFGVPQLGAYDPDFEPDAKVIIAIGDNRTRRKLASITRHEFATAIHSSAVVSSRASIETGSMILHGVIVQAECMIGRHVILNTGARVDHNGEIEDYVHIAPGAVIAGSVHVGEGAFIGAGAVIIPGRRIGAWATVGAGAVVTTDLPDHSVAVGVPARVIKMNKP